MNHRFWFLILLVVGVALGMAATAAADPTPSHKAISNSGLNLRDAEDLLHRRIAKDQYNSLLGKFLKDLKVDQLSPKDLTALKEIAKQHQLGQNVDLTDPKYDSLKKHLQDTQLNGLNLDSFKNADMAGLNKLLEAKKDQNNGAALPDLADPTTAKIMDQLVQGQNGNPGAGGGPLEDLLKNIPSGAPQLPGDAKPGNTPDAAKSNPGSAPVSDPATIPNGSTQQANAVPKKPGDTSPHVEPLPPPSLPAAQTASEPNFFSKWLLNAAEKATEGDDDAKSWLAETIKGMVVASGNKNQGGPSIGGDWSKLSEFVPAEKITDVGSTLSKMKPPALPEVNPDNPAGASLPGGDPGGASNVANVVVAVLLVVAVGVVAWVVLSKYKSVLEASGGDPWKLGAWPVQPSMVRTRADIVKAFEYLAVLVLGAAARTQHHLELAEELGQQAPTNDARRTEAARALARLYEIARYTPETETLPADDLAAARRELSFLAGAAAA